MRGLIKLFQSAVMRKKVLQLNLISLFRLIALSSFFVLSSCVKGDFKENVAPDTKISIESIDLDGEDRLNSSVRLTWFGTDADGFITGFEISTDNENWNYTQTQDSTILFTIPTGLQFADVDFYVRSIDNNNAVDPTPAFLRIPLKNSPPVASFDNDRSPGDTALCVATFYWEATDPDGDATIEGVEVRFNNGDWYPLSLGEQLISFVIDTSVTTGPATARVYYGTQSNAQPDLISGIEANADNYLQIRAVDNAGTYGEPDTAEVFFYKNKTPNAKLLWISGDVQSITDQYNTFFNNFPIEYDMLNLGADISGEQLPKYWDPTMTLLVSLYNKIFFNTGRETFTNAVTGRNTTILSFMAPVIQSFANIGGKSLITTSFATDADISELTGPYPIAGLVVSNSGQARVVPPDSGLVPLILPSLPKLIPASVQTGIVPITATSDAENFYRGQLLKLQGWTGTNTVATVRRPGNVINQIFFGLQLHDYAGDASSLQTFLEEILVNEF